MSKANQLSTHKEYTDWVIASVQQFKPDNYVYATGFLASYLTSLFEQDPWAYKRFRQHLENLKEERR
jgi:hypothetical protein